MAIDMSQFHQVFFEECFEGLDAMESGLLNLDTGDIDAEVINTIFRGAHSIKGGSGTFGFNDVADFTHVMEPCSMKCGMAEEKLRSRRLTYYSARWIVSERCLLQYRKGRASIRRR